MLCLILLLLKSSLRKYCLLNVLSVQSIISSKHLSFLFVKHWWRQSDHVVNETCFCDIKKSFNITISYPSLLKINCCLRIKTHCGNQSWAIPEILSYRTYWIVRKTNLKIIVWNLIKKYFSNLHILIWSKYSITYIYYLFTYILKCFYFLRGRQVKLLSKNSCPLIRSRKHAPYYQNHW